MHTDRRATPTVTVHGQNSSIEQAPKHLQDAKAYHQFSRKLVSFYWHACSDNSRPGGVKAANATSTSAWGSVIKYLSNDVSRAHVMPVQCTYMLCTQSWCIHACYGTAIAHMTLIASILQQSTIYALFNIFVDCLISWSCMGWLNFAERLMYRIREIYILGFLLTKTIYILGKVKNVVRV